MNRKKKIGSRVKKIEMLIKTRIRHLRLGASKVKKEKPLGSRIIGALFGQILSNYLNTRVRINTHSRNIA